MLPRAGDQRELTVPLTAADCNAVIVAGFG
jgi:hypothetical protein